MSTRFAREDTRDRCDTPEPVPQRDPEAAAFFDAMRLRASGMVPVAAFHTWWRGAEGHCFDDSDHEGDVLVIAVPSAAFIGWFEALYMGRLEACARELGRPDMRFRFVIVDREAGEPKLHEGSVR